MTFEYPETSLPDGKVHEYRQRWIRMDEMEIVHYVFPPGDMEKGEGSDPTMGDTHWLVFVDRKRGSRRMTIRMSEMTLEEIDAFKEWMNVSIDRARKICEYRDEIAQEAFKDGSTGYYRLYRTVPQVIDLQGSSDEHDQSSEE